MQRLKRDSRNLSAKEFAEQQGFTDKRVEQKTRLELPVDLTKLRLKLMSGASLRLLIKKYVSQQYPERIVLDAITRRLNEVSQ